jgi:hypothetical protein
MLFSLPLREGVSLVKCDPCFEFVDQVASGLSKLVTEFLKNNVGVSSIRVTTLTILIPTIGRLRPDFISRCDWETIKQSCTGYCSLFVFIF